MDINDSASFEARAERRENGSTQSTYFSEKLAVENQSSDLGKKYFSSTVLVALEISGINEKHDESAEDNFDLPFKTSPLKSLVVHNAELSEDAQKLAAGGQIKKIGDKVEMEFPNQDKVTIDSKNGNVQLESNDKYQKDLLFKGSPYQQIVLSSENDRKITIGSTGISSIESNGIKELFPGAMPKDAGSEPEKVSSNDLSQIFSKHGRKDLSKALSKADNAEAVAESALFQQGSNESNTQALSKAIKDRAVLIDKAAALEPNQADSFNVSAESQFRIALRNMRDQFGAGTPETKDFAAALKDHLDANQEKEQEDEIQRLGFEVRRGGLMSDVVKSVENADNKGLLAPEGTQSIRQALICMHILSGDDGLDSFVQDTNKRTSNYDLQAPIVEGGPFHHGAIMLTPDGATSYTGAFRLKQK